MCAPKHAFSITTVSQVVLGNETEAKAARAAHSVCAGISERVGEHAVTVFTEEGKRKAPARCALMKCVLLCRTAGHVKLLVQVLGAESGIGGDAVMD